jgi:hypothetical protein
MSRPAIHGDAIEGARSRLYDIWRGMRQRCSNPKANGYVDYGGRGITVVDEWSVYSNFREWAMLKGYSDKLSIERSEVDGNYEPGNCYWADSTTQACNKRKRANQTSKFIGVAPNRKGWQANVDYKGVRTYLGTHATEEEAALVRDAFVKKHKLPHKLNF